MLEEVRESRVEKLEDSSRMRIRRIVEQFPVPDLGHSRIRAVGTVSPSSCVSSKITLISNVGQEARDSQYQNES